MLTGIQITFMIFCWVTILGCLVSVIYSVVDMIRARHEERKKANKNLSQEQIDQIVAMVKKECAQQRDDNIHTDN